MTPRDQELDRESGAVICAGLTFGELYAAGPIAVLGARVALGAVTRAALGSVAGV